MYPSIYKAAKKPSKVVTVAEYGTLRSKDLNAFHIVHSYEIAVTNSRVKEISGIRTANPDLIGYFNFVDKQQGKEK